MKQKHMEAVNNMLLNNQWITKELKEEIKKIPREKWKNTNIWRLNNTFLNNEQVTEVKREIKKFLETNDNENTTQNFGVQQKQS